MAAISTSGSTDCSFWNVFNCSPVKGCKVVTAEQNQCNPAGSEPGQETVPALFLSGNAARGMWTLFPSSLPF